MPVKLPPKQRSNLFSFSLKTLGAAMATALLLSNASAAGLGKLTVLSALGQPLNAEIELSAVSKEEAAGLVPKLAPPEAFRQANIEMHPSLLGLRFAIEQRGSKQIIRVTSAQAMNEPFVDMLLEVGVPNGRLVREYTFLLDPPDVRAPQPAQVAATAAPSAPTEARLTLAPTPALMPLTPAAKPATPAAAPVAVAQYRPAPPVMPPAPPAQAREVRRGDTLSQIARENMTEGVSLDQMLVALYRSNPDAFIGKNMNRLRTGTILTLPDAAEATGTSNGEARRIVLAQANNFNEYRNQLAGQVANADAKAATDSKTTASGKVTAKVAEATVAADEARDKLKLSKSTAGNGAGKASAPADSAEDKIARDKAMSESAARVKDLERIVSDLQKVAEMKSKDLAERQKLAEAEQAKAAAPAPLPEAPAKPDVAAAKPAPAAAPAVPAPATPVKSPAAPATANLLDHPMVLPGAGMLLVLLGSLGFMAARRKRQAQQSEEHDFNESGLESNSIFAAPGGKHIDTSNSIFNSSFAASNDKSITNEVDPVAEADVYIAYGRDAQAEEILKEALRVNPERHPVRVKLLEIYASRKDATTFAAVAGELHDMTGGEGEQWQQAAALGSGLDPENPLYAGNAAAVDEDLTVNLPDGSAIDASGAIAVTPVAPASDAGAELDFYASAPGNTVSVDPLAGPPVIAADALTPSILASNIEEINFDFLDDGQEKPAPAKPASAMTAADLESEFALIEAALAKNGDVSPAPVPLEFDLSEITLDLSPADVASAKPDADAAALPTLDGVDEFDLDVGDEVNNNEMVTKLDLAAAYEEIGDNEGARELLEEVVSGGSAEQIAKARASLARLA